MEVMMKRCAYFLLAVFFVGMFSLALESEVAATSIYVWVQGIQGEAKDKDHKNWIDAESITHQIKQSGSMHVGGGGGAGRVHFGDFVVHKEIDKATPKLNLLCANGKHISEVIIELTAPYTDEGRVTYLQYKLEKVLVISVDTKLTEGKVGTEEVTLSFGRVTCTYTEVDSGGRSKGKISYSWDVQANKELKGQKSSSKPSGQTHPRYIPPGQTGPKYIPPRGRRIYQK